MDQRNYDLNMVLLQKTLTIPKLSKHHWCLHPEAIDQEVDPVERDQRATHFKKTYDRVIEESC